MDPEAAKTARESLELAFHMSNLLDTGLDRHTLSVLIALCDLGLNPEALAAAVKELRREPASSSLPNSSAPVAKPAYVFLTKHALRLSLSCFTRFVLLAREILVNFPLLLADLPLLFEVPTSFLHESYAVSGTSPPSCVKCIEIA
ncbi:hypothetical protein DKX38_023616 [Salix brachista]|uniref:Mitotic-spindle organizing protein 1 n=1 Tax=Salix brachista TaxID=2182728 RepID=A0A5N5JX45_9ROSI|nr:hypothetical protein DKX38_023616 [Salix brachista]